MRKILTNQTEVLAYLNRKMEIWDYGEKRAFSHEKYEEAERMKAMKYGLQTALDALNGEEVVII